MEYFSTLLPDVPSEFRLLLRHLSILFQQELQLMMHISTDSILFVPLLVSIFGSIFVLLFYSRLGSSLLVFQSRRWSILLLLRRPEPYGPVGSLPGGPLLVELLRRC